MMRQDNIRLIWCAFAISLQVLGGCAMVTSLDNFDQSFTTPIASVWFTNTASKLDVYYADTADERAIGLGNIVVLEQNAGMLFSYQTESSQPSFWMKQVEYPIDIIWIRQGKVSGVTANVQPEANTTELANYTRYPAPGLVDWVVEAPEGYVATHNIKAGDSFYYSLPE